MLIEWQLDALRDAGIEQIAIVRGYLANRFPFSVSYFENPRWHESNMVASLLAAHEWLRCYACIVSYSDIVYSKESVAALMQSRGDIVISYDPEWLALWQARFADPLSDAETFRIDDMGILLEIGNRSQCAADIQGQYMGLLRFTPRGWQQVTDFMSRQSPAQRDRMDMTSLLQQLLRDEVEISAVPCQGRWFEVDSQRDLDLYETMPSVLTRF